MTDFFHPEHFRGYELTGEKCAGCNKSPQDCPSPPHLRRELMNMVGLDWHVLSGAAGLVTVPLRKDYRTLKLDTTDIPDLLPLCLPCILEYMKNFNRRLQEMKDREKRLVRKKNQKKNRKER